MNVIDADVVTVSETWDKFTGEIIIFFQNTMKGVQMKCCKCVKMEHLAKKELCKCSADKRKSSQCYDNGFKAGH